MVAAYVCGTAVYISGVRCTGSLIPLLLGAIFGKCVREEGINLWMVNTAKIFHSFGLFFTRTGITTRPYTISLPLDHGSEGKSRYISPSGSEDGLGNLCHRKGSGARGELPFRT